MSWILEDRSLPDASVIDRLGNSYLSGNGHLGLRGTLDEHGAEHKAGLLVNGLYDQVPGRWREPVNAPHPLNLTVSAWGRTLDAATSPASEHRQGLDLRTGTQTRTTVFLGDGALRLSARRWVSRAHPYLVQAEWILEAQGEAVEAKIATGLAPVWDLNGPHLEGHEVVEEGPFLGLVAQTQEAKTPVSVFEWVDFEESPSQVDRGPQSVFRTWTVRLEPGQPFRLRKLAVVGDLAELKTLVARGFDALGSAHTESWGALWSRADVRISGDQEADQALRFSLYQLLSAAPAFPEGAALSIPARGVSGQVYKGAVFWDTEIFMLPFFLNAFPQTARSLLRYRIEGLPGALAKAAEYGYQGAFYAWESQDGGRDACTLFNVNDVFTGRPLRTFFRDKQIHITSDVILALHQYLLTTGDRSLLEQGGAQVLAEGARFLLSWMVWRPDRGRYELLDVTGPDEYHERVDNDYWTNFTAKKALEAAVHWLDSLEAEPTLGSRIREVLDQFYLPPSDPDGVLPQFDGYRRLEDATPAVLRGRQKHPHEYWGCGDGLARWTQVIKQADVVLALALFPEDHSESQQRANWEFYEPRTEHGSSLSACAYAITAARLGKTDLAYRYFLKTATIDLTGESKQYVGDLYIGGTHPAANGGAWMTVVSGFLGLTRQGRRLSLAPRLPGGWTGVSLAVGVESDTVDLRVEEAVTLAARAPFAQPLRVDLYHRSLEWWGHKPLVLPRDPRLPWQFPGRAALFDLDGVLVDTAKYHFLAWRRLALSLGFNFTETENEQLKGVSRRQSLEIILGLGGVSRTEAEKDQLCDQKNRWYVEMIGGMDASELLPGTVEYLEALRGQGVMVALGSASKNAGTILERTGITRYFDAVIDGTKVEKSKPDPEVFVAGARALGVAASECVVFEDSRSGLAAARAGGMASVGIGSARDLPEADVVVPGLSHLL